MADNSTSKQSLGSSRKLVFLLSWGSTKRDSFPWHPNRESTVLIFLLIYIILYYLYFSLMPSKSFLFYLWVASTEEAFEVNVKARPIISCVHIQQIISISEPKPTVLWLDKLSFLMIKMIMSCFLLMYVQPRLKVNQKSYFHSLPWLFLSIWWLL